MRIRMSRLVSVLLLILAMTVSIAAPLSAQAGGGPQPLVDNIGFETGDFESWVVSDLTDDAVDCQSDWHVDATGDTGCDEAGPLSPPAVFDADNGYAAYNSWDGAGPLEYVLQQDFTVPVGIIDASLVWYDTAVWDLVSYCGTPDPSGSYLDTPITQATPSGGDEDVCLGRQFHIDLLDGDGALIERLYTFEIEPLTTGSYDWTPRSVAVEGIFEAYWGETMTLRMTNVVPEAFTGPAGFGFDGVEFSIARQFLCRGVAPTIVGTPGDDVIEGTEGRDVVVGRNGNDVINGNGGDDLLCGNVGEDIINGGDGNDEVYGGDDDDVINGNDGDDTLIGNTGNDTVSGDAGADRVDGKRGDDIVIGGADDDVMLGGTGADELSGGDGDDRIWGNEGDDVIFGNAGNDQLRGKRGNDTLWGGDGNDVIRGQEGSDTLYGEAGNDNLWGNEAADVIWGDIGNDLIRGGEGADTVSADAGRDTIFGGPADDVLDGGEGDDIIWGQGGADTLTGDAGDDFLDGGPEADALDGGADTDTCLHGEGVLLNCEL